MLFCWMVHCVKYLGPLDWQAVVVVGQGGSKLYSKSIPRCELSATWQLLLLNVLVAEESSDKLVTNYLSVWRQF